VADICRFTSSGLSPLETRDAYLSKKNSDAAPVLDLLPLGYSKVLGKGRIPEIPEISVGGSGEIFSKLAEKKIIEAGGICSRNVRPKTRITAIFVGTRVSMTMPLADGMKRASHQTNLRTRPVIVS
jgi:hypothetical protein